MKRTNRIYLFFAMAALMGFLVVAVVYVSLQNRVAPQPLQPGIEIVVNDEDLVLKADVEDGFASAESTATVEPYQYLLREEEGYVVVYAADGKTVFEHTAILMRSLSEDLQEEIGRGKPIYSEADLYDFLESHSS